MNKNQRYRKQIASTVDPEIWERFRQLSASTRIPASRLLDEAMTNLLLQYQNDHEKTGRE